MVAAALAVYAEAGWSGFSFDAVARRAGVGKAPLYLRWASKEDLLLAAFRAAKASPGARRSRSASPSTTGPSTARPPPGSSPPWPAASANLRR